MAGYNGGSITFDGSSYFTSLPSYGDSNRYGGNNEGSNWLGRIWNDISGASANNEYNSREAEIARIFNSAEAEKDRQFQLYMSNTAYQRVVEDMQAAGINPAALGGNSVSPASTPQGSRANSSPAAMNAASYGNGILDIAKAAVSFALFKKFSGTAMKASSAASAVKNVGSSAAAATSAAKVFKASNWNVGAASLGRNSKFKYPVVTF